MLTGRISENQAQFRFFRNFLCYKCINDYICDAMKLIEMNMEQIIALCKKYKVDKLWVFGSIMTPRFNENSDVDLLVDFDNSRIPLLERADNFFDFIFALEDIFGRKVDMTINKAIRNPYFRKEVDETRKLLWSAV